MDRLEKALIILCLICLFVIGYGLYDDQWLVSDSIKSLEREVGLLTNTNNDVRKKSNNDLIWSKVQKKDQRVHNKDSIFTGRNSNAEISLYEANRIKMSSESLVVVNMDKNKIELDVEFGNIENQLVKDKTLIITQGKKSTKIIGTNAKIKVSSEKGKAIEIQVNGGDVKITRASGKTESLKTGDRFKLSHEVLSSEPTLEELIVNEEPVVDEALDVDIDQPGAREPASTKLETPQSLTKTLFRSDKKLWKYPVDLKWSKVDGATEYEVQVTRSDDPNKTKIFKARQNKFHVMVYPNTDYTWKVKALNEDATSDYSQDFYLTYASRLKEKIESFSNSENQIDEYAKIEDYEVNNENPDDVDKYAQKYARDTATEKSEHSPSAWSKFWGWVGAGNSFTDHKENITGITSSYYDGVKAPSLSLGGGMKLNDKHAVSLSYRKSNGEVTDVNNAQAKHKYNWQLIDLKGYYFMSHKAFALTYGIQHKTLPFVRLSNSLVDSNIIDSTLLSASLGGAYNYLISPKMRAEVFLNYHFPLSSSADGGSYDISSSLIFDGSIGLSYLAYKNLKLGLYWYSQYISSKYKLSNQNGSFSGDQDLMFSTIDFRIGLDY